MAALDGMALSAGLSLSYVKPHGALYNDMMSKPLVFDAVLDAIAGFYKPLKLMILATADQPLCFSNVAAKKALICC